MFLLVMGSVFIVLWMPVAAHSWNPNGIQDCFNNNKKYIYLFLLDQGSVFNVLWMDVSFPLTTQLA